ncbi:S-adenosyl-L-methionine-dependent methyltransferase [Mycena metata]|uniref:S-adenosyl-L-methionine-dependent methyltransferase n=1 Tax=Mycena metata TaxID=1033252 RepID=A0AAD7ITA6_9AGAR|nr:S-adenosyl-L-methionine-dependent methyltransferase [Mycena metata]
MHSLQVSTLRLLADIISTAVGKMEAAYERDGHLLPSLDTPFDPADSAESLRREPDVAAAIMDILAAAAQISATVRDPSRTVVQTALAFNISSCLRVASELNVVEIIRDAPSQASHVKEIAALASVDSNLLGEILRLLATHHIFREVSPNVFANNRISSVLDKGKALSDLLTSSRDERFTGTSGFAAWVEYMTNDIFRSATCLMDAISTPQDGIVPFNLAFGTTEPLYYWMELPENAATREHFGLAMQGTVAGGDPESLFHGFDWGSLGPGSIVVDVGGGNGHSSLTIAQRYPELHMMVQDLAHTVEEARKYWHTHFVDHANRGMVEFQAHDFFTPQPVKNANIFLLRIIAHNWPDLSAIKILKHLRSAALPTTRLVIMDEIVPIAGGRTFENADIPGSAQLFAQEPLLPNWGTASAEVYLFDIVMHILCGGVERTLDDFKELLDQAGWEMVRVHHGDRTRYSQLVAVPRV